MASSSSDDASSCSDSELEEIASKASNKIRNLLQKSRNVKLRKQTSKTPKKGKSDNKPTQTVKDTLGFVIDKTPLRNEAVDDETNLREINNEIEEDKVTKKQTNKKKVGSLSSTLQTTIQISDNYLNNNNLMKKGKSKLTESNNYDEIMKKSVITPDFEKQFSLTPYEESVRQQKKQRRKEREKTKGKNWFNMAAPEMTEEKKNDLTILHMRKALDPKRFYKNNDTLSLPKYFQLGTVVESSADFYHSRVPKKQRKSNMVDELLADAEFRKYNKRKYAEIQEQKRKAIGPYKHMKRLKKNKR